VRKTIVAEHVLATVEKTLEAAGGAGFYRKTGLERLLRDAHGAQFHPLAAKRQHRFTGRVLLVSIRFRMCKHLQPASRPSALDGRYGA
jgi:alkylation response protein AidB-like acyl-CoA dehydrogenase